MFSFKTLLPDIQRSQPAGSCLKEEEEQQKDQNYCVNYQNYHMFVMIIGPLLKLSACKQDQTDCRCLVNEPPAQHPELKDAIHIVNTPLHRCSRLSCTIAFTHCCLMYSHRAVFNYCFFPFSHWPINHRCTLSKNLFIHFTCHFKMAAALKSSFTKEERVRFFFPCYLNCVEIMLHDDTKLSCLPGWWAVIKRHKE